MIGQTVSHYRILEKLGEGGMGVVYKAEDIRLNRDVALKFLPPTLTADSDARQRFLREAQAASALDHPNICTVHDVGDTEDGETYIVMACYDGQTLKKSIEQGPLDIDRALEIAIQVAAGLSRAHGAGIVHRDLKPANIFVTTHGEVKILDFGLAKVAGQSLLTGTGTTMGTAAYMSPEQARSEQVDGRTDVWSLGVVLYEMITGQRPFQSDYEQALVYSILNEEPRPARSLRNEIPEVVEQIVAKALAKKPEERYQTIDDLLSDLKVARGTSGTGGAIAASEAMERSRRKRLVRGLIIAGAIVLVLLAGAFILAPLFQDQAIASNPKRIAFISFENQTGDRSFDNLQTSIPSLLTASLDESKFFRVLTWDRIHGLVREMGKGDLEFIDRETGLELCRRAGVDALAMGTFTKAGNMFLTSLHVIDVSSGEPVMQSLRADGRGVESILMTQVDELARQVSRGLGVSRWSTGTSLKPVQRVTTTSTDAYNFYVRGEYEYYRIRYREAERNFELAVKYDSTFASAWYFLAAARWYVARLWGDTSDIRSARRKAVQYASRASEREKWYIGEYDSTLRAELMGEPGKTDRIAYWQKCISRFPDDAWAHQNLGYLLLERRRGTEAVEHFAAAAPVIVQSRNLLVYAYLFSNQTEKAIEACRQYSLYAPGEPNTFDTMGDCLWYAGRFDEAIVQCEKALEVDPGSIGRFAVIGQLHFLKGEYDDAIACFDRARDPWWRAYTLVWLGRLKEAGRELHGLEKTPDVHWLESWVAYESGALDEARALLQKWAKAYLSSDEAPQRTMFVDYCFGLVGLKQGKMDSVEARLAAIGSMLKLARDVIDSTEIPLQFNFYGKALRAAYLLAAGRPAEIDPQWGGEFNMWPAEPERSHGFASRPGHSYAGPRTTRTKAVWVPVLSDIVPQAYVQRGMIDSAIIAYEWAVDRKIDYLCPIIPRYHYRLARLYEQKGMKGKAVDQYATFLKIWGKADPIFKEPADARARLAKLAAAREDITLTRETR
jgi:serine/threonine protein kinase/tetratricopeptide (TPR) repeat protein